MQQRRNNDSAIRLGQLSLLGLPATSVVLWLYCSWKTAAGGYLEAAGQLLSELQSQQGSLLTGELLGQVAAAREALDTADAAYNTALDRLEVRRLG